MARKKRKHGQAKPAPLPVVVNAGLDQDFTAAVALASNKIPRRIQNALAARGYEVRVVRSLVEEFPELAGQHPRGWPPGTTFESVPAVYYDPLIILAERFIDPESGKEEAIPNPASSFRHEIGHAVDAVYRISSSREFLVALQADKADLQQRGENLPLYFLQTDHAGEEEIVAELFAWLHGGGTNPVLDLSVLCPRAANVMRHLLRQ